jgi:hypothetical protein
MAGGQHCKRDENARTPEEARNNATIARAFDEWAAGTGGPYALLADKATWTIVGNSRASRRYSSRQKFFDGGAALMFP